MTQKPQFTKEQAEQFGRDLNFIVCHSVDEKHEDKWTALINEFQRGYLAYLDMVPRALSEIKESHAIIVAKGDEDEQTYTHHIFKNRKGEWISHIMGLPYSPETLAIPLSALPTPEGET